MEYFVWLIFAAVFFYFGYVHWQMARTSIRTFHFRGEGGTDPAATQVLQDFVKDFNNYLDITNKIDRQRNTVAAAGFLVAGFLALISWAIGTF
ncbi:MAG: hypothetical protein MUO23_14440 [Anaerolineales bacterium]|nr:hypothetical protein [Anaerolineales bacterium]